MDIKKKMEEYKVEYHVLQEEIALSNYNMELFNKEKEKTKHLEKQLQVSALHFVLVSLVIFF